MWTKARTATRHGNYDLHVLCLQFSVYGFPFTAFLFRGYYSHECTNIINIIFVNSWLFYLFSNFRIYFVPVLPKPPAPRLVSSKTSTSCHEMCSCLAITSWATRSPFSTMNSSLERFTRITPISPR